LSTFITVYNCVLMYVVFPGRANSFHSWRMVSGVKRGKRPVEVRPVPADAIRGFLGVDRLPELLVPGLHRITISSPDTFCKLQSGDTVGR